MYVTQVLTSTYDTKFFQNLSRNFWAGTDECTYCLNPCM